MMEKYGIVKCVFAIVEIRFMLTENFIISKNVLSHDILTNRSSSFCKKLTAKEGRVIYCLLEFMVYFVNTVQNLLDFTC